MLDLLLPPRCPVCRRGIAGRPGPCDRCAAEIPPPPSLAVPPGVDRCIAVCAYDRAGVALVGALKFRGERGVARWAACRLASSMSAQRGVGVDVVTWLPTTPTRRRRRGADQAEILARAVGRATRLPVRALLRRGAGPAQAGRTAAERRAGPAFTATASCGGARVLLVDDVVTTGASVSAAASVLRRGGATAVVVACLARTPPGRHARW